MDADTGQKMAAPSGHDEGLAEQDIREQVENRIQGPLSVDTSETETVSVDYDRLSIRSIGSSTSTTPTKQSSGLSTPTRRQSSTPPLPTPSHTPGSGDHNKPVRQSEGGDTAQTPTSSHGNRPHRPGILWKENGKIEAMDFQKKWFHARIVEIDDSDNTVLIHFDGWNQRFDEWVDMNSERLRPVTRHSGRKEKKPVAAKASTKAEHKMGDNVFAKWTDCRMYAGTIVGINTNGSYDVRFYDGFKKTVQPINVKTMSLEVQKEYAVAGILPNPEKGRKQRLHMVERIDKEFEVEEVKKLISNTTCKASAKKSRQEGEFDDSSNYSKDSRTTSPSSSAQPSPSIKTTPNTATTCDRNPKSEKTTPSEPKHSEKQIKPEVTNPRVLTSGTFHVKKVKGHTGKPVIRKREVTKQQTATVTVDDAKQEEQNNPQRSEQKKHLKVTPIKVTQPVGTTDKSDRPKSKKAKRPRPQKDKSSLKETILPILPQDGSVVQGSEEKRMEYVLPLLESTPQFTDLTVPGCDRESSDDELTLAEINKQRQASCSTDNIPGVQKKFKTEPSTSYHGHEYGQKKLKAETETCTSRVSYHSYEYVTTEPEKAFVVEEEHNKFKCPFKNCNKSFRKMSLVEYHLKYYHTEDGRQIQPLAPPPSRKRKHTLSVCSSDSEVSASGWGGGSTRIPVQKRRRESSTHAANLLEISGDTASIGEDIAIQDFSEVETHTTTTEEADQKEGIVTEYIRGVADIAIDCLSREEVVNCICQINEENGLMIQCDVCLCWQHALCMEITEETLPSKYVCYVCANPPGVRDSQRYSYDQDWLKQGTMASFAFLPEDPYMPQKAQIIQATHSLVGDMHGVNGILSSVNCQLHALRKPNHPEVKFWTKNWDKVNEEKKIREEEERLKAEIEADSVSQVLSDVIIKEEPCDEESCDQRMDFTNFSQQPEIKNEIISEIKTEVVDDTENIDDAHTQQESLKIADLKQSSESRDASAQGDIESSKQSEQICLEEGHPSSSSLSSLRSAASEAGLRPSTSAVSLASSKDSEEVLSPAVVTVQEETFTSCDQNLLLHMSSMQDNVESRLELVEEQIMALENADDNGNNHSSGDVLRDLPRVKKVIHQILNDLVKVKRISLYH